MIVLCFLGLALIGAEAEPPLPQCSDGIDNDGDNRTDVNDNQCKVELPFNPGEPVQYQYCPNWDDESTIPTLSECN